MTEPLLAGRQFQVWEYRVSHASLLIRSPASDNLTRSVDLIFVAVEYMALPNRFETLAVRELPSDEAASSPGLPPRRLPTSKVWRLDAGTNIFWVVAGGMVVREHHGDIFESPFT